MPDDSSRSFRRESKRVLEEANDARSLEEYTNDELVAILGSMDDASLAEVATATFVLQDRGFEIHYDDGLIIEDSEGNVVLG